MLGEIRDRSIRVVYGAIFTLGVAYGISLALTPLHMNAHGFTKTDIGSLAVFFGAGVVGLSLPMGNLIRRFTARMTLFCSLLGYAVVVAAFPFATHYSQVAFIRTFDGAFSVGIWVSCETILLARADAERKATIASLYAIAMGIGYVLGPVLARILLLFTTRDVCFFVAGVVAVLAATLVYTQLEYNVLDDGHHSQPPPAPTEGEAFRSPSPTKSREPLGYGALLQLIKTSCFATFAYGYFQATVVLFLPLYLMETRGVAENQTVLTTAFFAGGMLLVTNFTARLGDRFGHLLLMRVLAVIGTFTIVSFNYLPSFWMMCGAVFVAGATLATISPVSLALQGVVVERRDLARANSIYNVFYAAGMLLGPPISSRLFRNLGGAAMLWHLVLLWGAFVLFSVVYATDDPHVRRMTNANPKGAGDAA